MNTQPARGMRDFLPADVRRREYVVGIIKEVYERYGFEPLETPAVENIETLLGKYGEEGNQLIFKILKRGEHEKTGEADLALRYDLTVPLARVVAEYGEKLPKFFKRYQIQPVWRADRPARGRFREFYQCDVDAIGSRSPIVEAELCAAASESLTKLGFDSFTVHLNHRMFLTSLLESVGIEMSQHASALTALDKLDKIGIEGVKKEFNERNLSEIACIELVEFFSRVVQYAVDVFDIGIDAQQYPSEKDIKSWNDFTLSEMRKFVVGHAAGEEAIKNLETILELTMMGKAAGKVVISPSLARGLSYYTGAIMEISVPDLAGSLGGGGRYDNLIGMFSGKDVPACGFSLGLERIIVLMTERKMFPPVLSNAAADVMIAIMGEEFIPDSMALARDLRNVGIRVFVYPQADKLQKQFAYANSQQFIFVALIGERERENGTVTIKHMRRGDEYIPQSRDVVVNMIKDELAGDLRLDENSRTFNEEYWHNHKSGKG